jgi:hypothetical protein
MNDDKKITIRIPHAIHAKLVELAKQDTRSLNAEILVLLREAITQRGTR